MDPRGRRAAVRRLESETEKVTTGPLRRARARSESAFSLFELVVIVFVMGTLAVLAAPSLQRTFVEYEVGHAAAEVQNLTRYARSRALTGLSHVVLFDIDNNTVSVLEVDDSKPAPDPMRGKQDCILQLGAGSRFSHTRLLAADFAGSQKVSFDRLGNASSTGTVDLGGGDFVTTIRVTGPGGRVTIE